MPFNIVLRLTNCPARGALLLGRLCSCPAITLVEAQITEIDPPSGVATIEVFKARIGAVNYVSHNASDHYPTFQLGLKSGELADNRLINQRLNRLAATDGVLVDAAFNPGAARGLTDLDITLAEPPLFSGAISFDSYGTPFKATASLM